MTGSLHRCTYTPTEVGTHALQLLYGNLPLPGGPFGQTVAMLQLPDAYGDGLFRARRGVDAEFFLNVGTLQGHLSVELRGLYL